MRIDAFGLALAVLGGPGQAAPTPAPPAPIADNSFLIEEAYNQDPGVVQHILAWSRDRRSGDWSLGFTQEWPLRGQRHQLSFSLPMEHLAGETGLGDGAVNYRIQVLGVGGGRVAFAPRASLVAPTGDADAGRGGQPGVQFNLPLSVDAGHGLMLHSNVGVARGFERDALPAVTEWSLGQSLIWLVHPRVNLMLEAVAVHAREAGGEGGWEPLLGPGVRAAFDWGGVQVVPGLAFQFGVGPARGERRLFLYLSFEHPFR